MLEVEAEEELGLPAPALLSAPAVGAAGFLPQVLPLLPLVPVVPVPLLLPFPSLALALPRKPQVLLLLLPAAELVPLVLLPALLPQAPLLLLPPPALALVVEEAPALSLRVLLLVHS